MLKLFIKSGQPVQNVFADMLQSIKRPKWLKAVQKVMALIHPKDFKEVLLKVGLATEQQELRETIKELLKDDIEKEKQDSLLKGLLEGMREGEAKGEAQGELKASRKMAKQMKADGHSIDMISKYTGLSPEEIEEL